MQNSKIKNQNLKREFKGFCALILFLIFALYTLTSLVNTVLAQSFSLGLYPPLLSLMIQPGKTVTQVYQLENYGDEAVTLNTTILPFSPSDEHGNIAFPSTAPALSPTWFSFANTDVVLNQPFTLYPGQVKQIILKIDVPERTIENDHYFTLLFSTIPSSRKTNISAAQQAGAIGSNILITVSKDGQPVKKGTIVEFKTQGCFLRLFGVCFLDSLQKPRFLLRVRNTSKAFWQPFGTVKVEGLINQQWEENILPDNVLTNSIRQLNFATSSASPLLLVGPYQAKAEFTLEETGGGVTLTATTSFLMMPIKIITGLVAGLLLLILIFKAQARISP